MINQVRLFAELQNKNRILIAGAGGGYDIYSGVPLYSALRRLGHDVFLSNLTFTNTSEVDGDRLAPGLVEVTPGSAGPERYFPERSLARFLESEALGTRIFALDKQGVVPTRAAFETLVRELQLDALILVDGGTDVLMRGDERGLGTPAEDMTSLAAAQSLSLQTKAVCCLGFGIDAFHGVRHAQFLQNVADLTRNGGSWGCFSVTPPSPDAELYLRAVRHSEGETTRPSIVNGSIADAMLGEYGDIHRYPSRTQGSTLWINPLMALYWTFDLSAVAEANLYLERLSETKTMFEVQLQIEAMRHDIPRRQGPETIPH